MGGRWAASLVAMTFATLALVVPTPSAAAIASVERMPFDIRADNLEAGLLLFAEQARVQLVIQSSTIRGLKAHRLTGRYTRAEALEALIGDAAVVAEWIRPGTVAIRPAATPHVQPVAMAMIQDRPSTRSETTEVAPPAVSASSIPEIIVTANKRAQSINDVGLTIAALGSDALEKQGIKTLDDLARSVPGLTFAATDYGTPIFTLRGVGFYDNSLAGSPTTSVYVDEVPLPFPVMATHANLDLERVEVLKGPQGTLFGQNSTGGAINFIAAKPTNAFAAGLDVSIGRFGAGEANGFVSGPLTDTLGVRLAGQYGYGNPWQRSFTRDDRLGKKSFINGRLLVNWEPTPDLKISLNLNGWRDRSDPQAGQYIATFPQVTVPDGSSIDPVLRTYPFAPSDPRSADWNPDFRPKADKRQYQAALRADLNLANNIVLTSISSYVRYKTEQTLDLDSTTAIILDYLDLGSIKSFTQELRVAGGDGTPFRWVLGGNYESSDVFEQTINDYSQSTVANILDVREGTVTGDNKFRNHAIFANSEYDIIDTLTIKIGARYTKAKRSANLCTADSGDGKSNAFALSFARLLNPGLTIPDLQIGDCTVLDRNNLPARFIDTLSEHNFSWRVGVDYKPSRNLLLYANVSKGYKGGGYPIIGAFNFTGYLPVVQESLLDYEAGFKTKFLDRKLGLNGAVFYYDYGNKQLLTKVIDSVVGLVPALANIPKSEVKGAELELTAAPVDGLNFSAGVTYLDAKITKYTGVNAGGAQADFAGTPIPFTPKWQYSANVDYDFAVVGNIHPFVGATLMKRTGTSSIVGDASGAVPQPGYRSSVPLADTYDLPGYALLDLRAGIEAEDGSWRLMVWGKNVTNKYYWQNVVTAYDVVTRYAGQPATYGVTFRYSFL
jgi:outer membrane receptor protein involved in Fe transport